MLAAQRLYKITDASDLKKSQTIPSMCGSYVFHDNNIYRNGFGINNKKLLNACRQKISRLGNFSGVVVSMCLIKRIILKYQYIKLSIYVFCLEQSAAHVLQALKR